MQGPFDCNRFSCWIFHHSLTLLVTTTKRKKKCRCQYLQMKAFDCWPFRFEFLLAYVMVSTRVPSYWLDLVQFFAHLGRNTARPSCLSRYGLGLLKYAPRYGWEWLMLSERLLITTNRTVMTHSVLKWRRRRIMNKLMNNEQQENIK